MKELLTFILEGVLGKKDFEISKEEENGNITLQVKANPEDIGLIIGKGGNTVKAITTLLRVKGRVEGKMVSLNVS